MMKPTSLALSARRLSYPFSRHSRNCVSVTAGRWESKLHQSNPQSEAVTNKPQTGSFIVTGGLFNEQVFSCTEGVCGNASHNQFFNSSSISMYSQEEELVIAEHEDCTISISDDDSADEYESLSITTAGDVMHVAMKLLAKKGFSVAELRNMLSEKKFPLDIVDNVIEAMKNRGYLNDGVYAESFSRSRFLHSLWGPELIKQALLLKGIPDMEAEKAIRRVFQDNYDYHNKMLTITTTKNNDSYAYDVEEEMSQSAMDYLYLQASKQWTRERNIPLERRKVYIIRWLRDRSFSSRVTGAILKKFWSERFQPDEY